MQKNEHVGFFYEIEKNETMAERMRALVEKTIEMRADKEKKEDKN